jgi:four helix bundle protein
MREHKTLLCWQSARDLTIAIHRLTVRRWSFPASVPFTQLRRAALSIRLNIAEGHALGTPGAFARHLTIAYGSAVETAEVLEYCVEIGLLESREVQALLQSLRKVQAMLIGLKRRCLIESTEKRKRRPTG